MLFICPFVVGWLAVGDPVSQAKWDRIHEGMTKAEVIAILGKPDAEYGDGSQFVYSGFLNAGWVAFDFDGREVLVEKNDESAFGSLR